MFFSSFLLQLPSYAMTLILSSNNISSEVFCLVPSNAQQFPDMTIELSTFQKETIFKMMSVL